MAERTKRVLGSLAFLFAVSTLVSQTLMDVFASLFAIVFCFWAWREPRWTEGFRRLTWGRILFLWIGVFFLSALVAGGGVPLLKILHFRWLILSAMLGSYLIVYPPNVQTVRSLAVFVAIASAYAILIFVLQFDPLNPDRPLDPLSSGYGRSGGFLVQPIVFAHLYVLWFFLGAGLLWERFRRGLWETRTDGILSFSLGLCLLAILFSFTRGAWIALAFALLPIFLLPGGRKGLQALLSLAVLGAAVLMLVPPLRQRVLDAFEGRDSERLWIWKANFRMFLDHPWWGVGYTRNADLLPTYYQNIGAPEGLIVSHAHNQFLHVLAGTGVTGFLFYLAFWVFLLIKSLQAFQRWRDEDSFRSGLALGTFAALSCFMAGGLTESNYEHSKIRYVLALMVGLVIWLSERKRSGQS